MPRRDLRLQLESLFSGIEDVAGEAPVARPLLGTAAGLFSEPQECAAAGESRSLPPADGGEGVKGGGGDRQRWPGDMLRWIGRSLAALLGLARYHREGQPAAVGLGAFMVLLLAGALAGSLVGPLLGMEPPAAAAMALASPSPSPAVIAQPSISPATPSPTVAPTRTRAPPTSLPSSTPSPTPRPSPSPLPSPITAVVPSPFPTPAPTALAALSSTLPIPLPVAPVPVAPDAVNILVLGSDRRPDWTEWHTDAIHIVSVQTNRVAVSVLSIPRDLYVYVPGFWMSRINFADYYGEAYGHAGGGTGLLKDTLLYNLGIRVDYVVRTDFDGLIGIVDTVGGVDIPVHCRLSDYWPYPDEKGEYPILTLEPGVRHMDGETALWYSRSRLTTSVFSRDRRQQQVLQAIWHKMRDTGVLTRIPALWEQVQEMVVTDMGLSAILDLARVAISLDEQDVRFYSIGPGALSPWVTPYGGNVFLPRWEAIEPIVAEVMAPIPEARLGRTFLPVEVWNGTANPDWDQLAVDRLYRAGFPAVAGEPDQRDYAQAQLIVYSDRTKGSGVEYLRRMFDIADERLIYQPGGSSTFGFRLILGPGYQTCPW